MSENTMVKGKYLTFLDKPLVRDKNMLCYGSMSDKYVLLLIIVSSKTVTDKKGTYEVPDRVIVQIWNTDASLPPLKRMEKQCEKTGLYDAMDIGLIWLDRMNK